MYAALLMFYAVFVSISTGYKLAILKTASLCKSPLVMRATIEARMPGWLDDIIYSGDMYGAIQRRAKDVVNDDFLDFLDEKLAKSEDRDMKEVLSHIITLISNKLELNEGLADAGEVFEKRLNKILFTAPGKRKEYIESNKQDLSVGFIEYVQKELKATSDIDSKVVIASVLQMIGQAQDADLLGKEAYILQRMPSLGSASLLLDSIGTNSEDLQRDMADKQQIQLGDRNEQVNPF